MPKKVTPKDYMNKCKVQGYDLPIENYISAKVKIKHKCSKGHIYEQTPSSHLRGKGCPKCKNIKLSISKKRTPEEYYQECKSKRLDLPIEKYKGNSIKIKHKCTRNHIYEQRPKDHLKGQGCPKCSNNYSYTSEEYYSLCKENDLDLPTENYIDTKTKIKHMCSKCGNIYEQTPNKHLIRGHGCPKCGRIKMIISRAGKNKKKTPQEYYNECKSKGLDLPIEKYINNSIKIKHKCSKGHIYKQEPASHLQNYGCPICNESHGEKYIRNYLDKYFIKYIPQKKFNDLKDKTYLSYDFYLPNNNILIEYQGKQHYSSIDYFGGKETFKKQQLHDKLKREYAKDNGYKLLELHYSLDTQEKVNKYLTNNLSD